MILEKVPGNYEVDKLRALLLLEADFNVPRKINFNRVVIPSLEASSVISREIIGGTRLQVATHLSLSKNLIADI